MPRTVFHSENFVVEDPRVSVQIQSGVITVTGPRGVLSRDVSHLGLDVAWHPDMRKMTAKCLSNNRQLVARCGTLFSHVKDMITGVTKGYRYKMRFVTSHVPTKHSISDAKDQFKLSHFMGHGAKRISALAGVQIRDSPNKTEEIWVEGNDRDAVCLTCARIHKVSSSRNRSLTEFLNGMYVSERGYIDA